MFVYQRVVNPKAKKTSLVGGWPTLKNDGVRQWEGWHPIYEMENKKCSKPPTRKRQYIHHFKLSESREIPEILAKLLKFF